MIAYRKQKKIKSIKAYMTPFPYKVECDTPVQEAQAMMKEHDIRHLPVSNDGKLVGVISERDINWALDPVFDLRRNMDLKVENIYRKDIYKVDFNEPVDVVLKNMAHQHIGSVLVLKDDKLVGIFTTVDACDSFAEHLREGIPHSEGSDLA